LHLQPCWFVSFEMLIFHIVDPGFRVLIFVRVEHAFVFHDCRDYHEGHSRIQLHLFPYHIYRPPARPPDVIVGAKHRYKNVTQFDENALKAAAYATVISVAIDASSIWFQLYSSGVYNQADCKTDWNDLDHGVTGAFPRVFRVFQHSRAGLR
jgi:hypothetical protein